MGAHKILFMTGVLFTVFLLAVKGEETERPRRYFWDLGYMLYKVADLNLWELAKLNFHGNYCGWGGSGIPVNELDKCCMIHDKCYGKWKGHCGHFSFRGYKYSCPRKGYCKCTDTRRCGSEACRCDLDFSWCVKRHVGHLRG